MTPENVKCPKCSGPMVPRKSSFGMFWGCKDYPQCKGTRDSMGLSKAERTEARAETEEQDPFAPHHYGRWDR
jgi:ssDNA-binding Zn-finger/Zn-ribbon topoisomerase 1